MTIIVNVLGVLVALLICVVTFFKWRYKYWQRNNVPFFEPTFPFGTLSNPFYNSKALCVLFRKQYEEAKKKYHKFIGMFIIDRPTLLVVDLDLAKNVLTKDFHHFVDRGIYTNERDDPLSAHLFSLEGTKWKNLRVKMTPTFTSSKMKMMFNIIRDCGLQLQEAVGDVVARNQPLDIKEFVACFATDVIGSCAFGVDCNSFKNPNSDFRKYSKLIFLPPPWKFVENLAAYANASLARFLRIKSTQPEVHDFFMNLVKNTVQQREQSGKTRNDFLQILIDLKNSGDSNAITINELAAQCFIFFAAGFETSSTTITFCLYELSQNQKIQQKVRDEVNAVLKASNDEITYESVKKMNYLTQVIEETLRKYPPLPWLPRQCVADYKIPDTEVTIKKGVGVIIPIYGIQNDPDYFPDPETFDPDRFAEENKKTMVPFTYLPFGDGPRVCIGLRFGMMQTRIGLLTLLRKYKFTLNEKTSLPLKMNSVSITLSVVGDVWLNVEKV